MRENTRKTLIAAFCLALTGSVAIGMGALKIEHGAAAESSFVNADLTMESGASEYLNEVSGIRYTYTAANYDPSKTYGMLIVPNDYLTRYGITISDSTDYITELTNKGVKYIATDGIQPKQGANKGETVTFQHAIGELYTYNYDRGFFGVGYVKDADGAYTYAKTSDNVRSVMYIASAALNDLQYNENLSDEYKSLYEQHEDTLSNFLKTGVSNVNSEFEYTLQGEGTIIEGKTQALTLANLTNGNREISLAVKWESSDESIATVKDGVVTAHSAGNPVTITAKTATGNGTEYSASLTIEVKPDNVKLFKNTVNELENGTQEKTNANVYAAYQVYLELADEEKKQAEVSTAYETLWAMIPDVLNKDHFMDFSTPLAIAYNRDNVKILVATHDGKDYFTADAGTELTLPCEDAWNLDLFVEEYTNSNIFFTNGFTPSVTVKPSLGMYWHDPAWHNTAYNGGALFIELPTVTKDTTIRFSIQTDAGAYIGVVTENDRFSVGSYMRDDGYSAETNITANAATVVLANLKANVQSYIRIRSNARQYKFFHTGFNTVLSSIEVTDAKELFKEKVDGLTAASSDAEFIEACDAYTALPVADQADTVVQTAYKTLGTLVQPKLDSKYYVDFSTPLAIAYNRTMMGIYGRLKAENNKVVNTDHSRPLTVASVEAGVKITPVSMYWHSGNDTYNGGALFIALPTVEQDTTITFTAQQATADTYVGVVTESDMFKYDTYLSEYSKEVKVVKNTEETITITLKAKAKNYVRIRTYNVNAWHFYTLANVTTLSSISYTTE